MLWLERNSNYIIINYISFLQRDTEASWAGEQQFCAINDTFIMIRKYSSVQVLLLDWSQIWAREQWDRRREDWCSSWGDSPFLWHGKGLFVAFAEKRRKQFGKIIKIIFPSFQKNKSCVNWTVSMKAGLGTCRNQERAGNDAAVGLHRFRKEKCDKHGYLKATAAAVSMGKGVFPADHVCKKISRGPGWIFLVLPGPLHWSGSSFWESTCSASESSRFSGFI